MMDRRRALMGKQKSESWDFAWDYTQGKLEDQDGWTTSNTGPSGSFGSSLETSGQKLWANLGSFYQIYPINANPVRFMTNGIGVLECVFVGHFMTSGDAYNRQNLRIHCVKDSECRMSIMEYSTSNLPIKFRILNNSSLSLATIIADFSNDTEYTVRIELNGATADIYVNGVKVGNSISTSNIINGGSNSLMIQNTGGPSYYALLKAIRIKIGRI